jgi:hypothetical protein
MMTKKPEEGHVASLYASFPDEEHAWGESSLVLVASILNKYNHSGYPTIQGGVAHANNHHHLFQPHCKLEQPPSQNSALPLIFVIVFLLLMISLVLSPFLCFL